MKTQNSCKAQNSCKSDNGYSSLAASNSLLGLLCYGCSSCDKAQLPVVVAVLGTILLMTGGDLFQYLLNGWTAHAAIVPNRRSWQLLAVEEIRVFLFWAKKMCLHKMLDFVAVNRREVGVGSWWLTIASLLYRHGTLATKEGFVVGISEKWDVLALWKTLVSELLNKNCKSQNALFCSMIESCHSDFDW